MRPPLIRQIPDIAAMLEAGALQISPDVWDSLPSEAIHKITVDFFAGLKGSKPEPQTDYAAIGRCALAAFDVGDAVVHALTDHAHSIIELVVGE